MTSTDIDLIFAKVKAKTERRITFDQFGTALEHIATKKGVDKAAIEEKVASSKGPILAGTQADAVRFHDDKSSYTGVYAQGGPTNVDKQNVSDISQILDRSAADVRGVKQGMASMHLGEELKEAPAKKRVASNSSRGSTGKKTTKAAVSPR